MVDLTNRICWELIKKEGYIAVWRKPLNNSCYNNREAGAKPPLCRPDDDPDDVWYISLISTSIVSFLQLSLSFVVSCFQVCGYETVHH